MKRIIISLTLCAGLLNGCSETQTVRSVAGLSGTYDLTIVGQYVFATSTDTNELRVLDLHSSPRDWVRAPNPLEPLSIPVLARPSNLTRGVTYELETRVTKQSGRADQTSLHLHEGPGGPLVYARSAGSRQISVVSADPGLFREVQRLDLEKLQLSGLVTAFAARGPVRQYTRSLELNEQGEVTKDEIVSDGSSGDSVLYFAVQEGAGARLYRTVLSETGAIMQGPAPVELSMSGRSVTSLLVLPPPQDQLGQELLVVATRGAGGTGSETFRLDINNPQAPRLLYDFNGAVRLLATHAEVESTALAENTCELDTTPPAKASLRAGEYIFGVLDESQCESQEQESCSGIAAVETATGERAKDSTGRPMLPIRVGQALPMGLALAPNTTVELLCGGNLGVQVRPLVGIVPTSDGKITLFDAAKLRPFDLEPEAAKSTSNQIIDINGQSKVPTGDFANNHIDLDVLEGATRDETYRVIYQGVLQGLARRPFIREETREGTAKCDGSGCSFFVDEQAVDLPGDEEAMVRVGDLVQLDTASGTCSTELSVTGVRTELRPGGAGQRGVFVTGSLPADCQEPTSFTVRAGPQYPMVVYSDSRGYLGRLAPGGTPGDQPFPIPGGYYFHPSNFTDDPRYRTASAYLRVYNLESLDLKRGDQLTVAAQSGFRPFTASVETSSLVAGLAAYRLPGPVVHAKVGDSDFAYIAYPSADGILQVALSALRANVANSTGLVPFD